MVTRKSLNGRNSAERAPTTTFARPSAIAAQAARRSLAFRSECHATGAQPKRLAKRASHGAVSAISGTSTSAWPPWRNAAAIASKYTSVLPDPVTPSSRNGAKPPAVTASAISPAAAACSVSSTGGAKSGSGTASSRSAPTRTGSSAPALIKPRRTASETPASRARSRTSPCSPASFSTAVRRSGVIRAGKLSPSRYSVTSRSPRNATDGQTMRTTAARGAR